MALYSDKSLMEAFYNSLSSDGVLVMQLGESPELHYSDETRNKFKNRAEMERLLEEVGFESVHVYEEVSRSGITSPRDMCMKYVNFFFAHTSHRP